MTDDALLDSAALRRQDPIEYERLYRAFAPSLRLYLLRLCQDADIADDLLQDTFRKAYCALPATTPDLQVRPWLYTIATNTARSAARMAYWRRVSSLDDRILAQQAMSDSILETRAIDTELIDRTLAAIKPEHATLLLLHWHEGFSIDELSSILEISRDTLKKRLYRARKAFSTAYAHESAETAPRQI